MDHKTVIEAAERKAIRDQVHPRGARRGLNWVSNGEQRKAGYTYYLPNRGFETFANFGNVPCVMGLQKLEALAEEAALASQRLSLKCKPGAPNRRMRLG